MNRPLLLLSLLFTAPVLAESAEEKAILQVERDWCAAALRGDAAALDQLLLDDYTLTGSTGVVTTKANDVAEAKQGDPQYEVFENRDMKVRVHGDTAVVTGRTVVKGVSGGKPFSAEFQFTDTLAKVKGRWRPLAGHVSRLTKS
ncbi:nuclear transport factor 2 family protein [Corallococcus sp. H22C18031201]|uniref:nuclear transport factor 2 family protein n=1 Tax=Citreicoccus inhibens TaxID=2849499 RepID=UPI000E717D8C|nr:nuclear transport factor 2 family protein [Citreicoccus inhibens]MBU8895713.1 nuclear transport factor 2 family protein [Citreicoccus inhibens]RJS20136.1 nuclear transport factor 2 family protein [Corallococcus sp. H22C18031201]